VGGQLHDPVAFSMRKEPWYPLLRSEDEPHVCSDSVRKGKIPSPVRNLIPVVKLVAGHCTDWAVLAVLVFSPHVLQIQVFVDW